MPEDSVTEHTMLVRGRPIHYRATAGFLPIQRDSEQPVAHIFFVAYERLDAGDAGNASNPQSGNSAGGGRQLPGAVAAIRNPTTPPKADASCPVPFRQSNRPITFAFNGGPGASAVWLHMGAFGPKRAILANDGTSLPPSNQLRDNEQTWLEFTDLVFVDPVGTGFSHAGPGVEPEQFYSVQKDTEIAADFVRLFVTQHERWLCPQFLVGESYGTARAVGMARRLQDRYGLYVNGLILLSSALNLGVISFDPGNDLPYALSLPSYTAVAQYHGQLRDGSASDLERTLQRVQAWALGDYLAALAQGRSLSPPQSREIAKKLAEYTGLPEDMVVQNRLRIGSAGFAQGLLSPEGRVLGLLDGRVTAPSVPLPRRPWIDPSLFIVEGPFVAAFNSYVRTQLGFKTDRPYIFLSDKANESWNWGSGRQGYFNIAPVLADVIGLDNRLRVFAAAGYYDLTTPYLSQEYVFHHLDLPSDLAQNITFRRYHAGHQIYTSEDALRQLTEDVRTFVTAPGQAGGRLGAPNAD
ncbi:MAG: peptidase S10 [Planctomycetes bacterium]|nr:peptidase S10 [Planctomycetota bacterium]